MSSSSPRCLSRAGMKGGSVQNPIHALASFVSDLHAPNGSVAVQGFYECAARPVRAPAGLTGRQHGNLAGRLIRNRGPLSCKERTTHQTAPPDSSALSG